MQKGKVISVSGKGGTGKTAIAALLIREILKYKAQEDICILAIDADADSNLPDALGISYDKTAGDIRESLLVIDCEAGLEHLSRRTTRDVDVMLIVLDTTVKSRKTALRLRKVAEEIDAEVKKMMNVANKIPEGAEEQIIEEAKKQDLDIEEIIPFDPLIPEYDLKGIPIVALPDGAPSVTAVRRIVKRIV